MQTALQLFAREGFRGTSVGKIAREAGISQGLMYNFFSGKADLLQAIFRDGYSQIKSTLTPYQEREKGTKALSRHLDLTLQLVRENRDFWRLFHSIIWVEDLREVAGEYISAIESEVLEVLTAFFQSEGYQKPELEARLLFGTFDGLMTHYLLRKDAFPIDEIKPLLLAKYQ